MSATHPHVLGSATTCGRCGALMAFARLDSGKSMPINVDTDPAGTVAVRVSAAGQIRGRVLNHERPAAEGAERLHVAHFATCGRTHVSTPRQDGAVPLYVARAKRALREGRGS